MTKAEEINSAYAHGYNAGHIGLTGQAIPAYTSGVAKTLWNSGFAKAKAETKAYEACTIRDGRREQRAEARANRF